MARNHDRDRDRKVKRVLRDSRPGGRTKVCAFCKEGATYVDFKDVGLLRRFMTDRSKIRSRHVTGNCAQHQRDVQVAVKTARELALLPYEQRNLAERGPGRGPRPARPADTGRSSLDTAPGEVDTSEEQDMEAGQLEEVGV